MMACKRYPRGYQSNFGHGRLMKCVLSPPDKFTTDLLPQTLSYEENSYCASGRGRSTTIGFSKPICRIPGAPCPVNTFEDSEGDCNICSPNYRVDARQKTCVLCESGIASMGGSLTKCVPCSVGEVPISSGVCGCPPGSVRSEGVCTPCPEGTWLYFSSCRDCRDNFLSKEGSTKCSPCPDGTFTALGSGNKCEGIPRCPEGYVPGRLVPTADFPEEPCVSSKTGCPPGHVMTLMGKKCFVPERMGKLLVPLV